MTKYIFNNEEYTFEQVQDAAKQSGVDIDTYIKETGLEVVSEDLTSDIPNIEPETQEQSVEKPKAVVEETAPAAAETVNTDLQLENGSLDLVPYNESDLDSLARNFKQGEFRQGQKAAYDAYQQTGLVNESLLPPKKEKADAWELLTNVWNNTVPSFKTAWEGYKGLTADWIAGVAGKDAADWLYGDQPKGAIEIVDPETKEKISFKKNPEKWRELSGRIAAGEDIEMGYEGSETKVGSIVDDYMINQFEKVAAEQKKIKYGGSIVKGFKEGDIGETVGGVANVISGLVTTMVPAIATRGASLVPQMTGQSYADYNLEKARTLYGDDPNAFNKLIEEDKVEFTVPVASGLLQAGLERVGLKGITKAINKLPPSAKKNVVSHIWSGFGEGTTEYSQGIVDTYSQALAAGKTTDEAADEAVKYLTSDEALESFIGGVLGSGITVEAGRRLRKLNAAARKNTKDVAGASVVPLSILRQREMEASDPDVKEGIRQQIKEIEDNIKAENNEIEEATSNMSTEEQNSIITAADLAKDLQAKLDVLNEKASKNEITREEQELAKKGYVEEFQKQRAKIQNIVEEAKQRTPEQVSERTVKNADAINQAYAKDQSNDTFFDVVLPNMDDLLTSIVNRKFRENPEFGEQGVTKTDFKEDLIYGTERNRASSLYGIYKSFRPEEGQLLTTYITNNLENRSKRIVDERLGKQATVGGVSIDTQESRQLEAEEIDIPVMQGPKFTKRLGLSDEIMNKARKAAVKALSTAKNVDDKKFVSDIVETINGEIFEDIRALVPKPKEREAFMQEFAGVVWDAMPQSSMAKATRNETFKEWGIEAPTKEAFIDYFLGRDQEGLKTSTINDRAKKQLPQYLAKAIGAEYAQDLLENDPEVRERFKLTQKQEVEETVSDIQKLQVAAEKDLAVEEFASNFEDARSFNKFVEKFINFVPHDNTKQVKRSNKEDAELIRSTFLRLAKEGKINPESWAAARFGNFGAVYDENGNPQPKTARGGLYYGVKDPKYLETLNEAEKNWKGERFGDPKKLGFGESNNPVEGRKINQKKFKEVTEAFNEQAKINQNLVIQATENVANLIKEGENPYIVGILLHNAYKATRGVIKASYEFKLYEGGDLEYGTEGKFTEKDAKGNKRLVVREEHSPPVKVFGAELLKAGLTVPPEKIRLRVEDMYNDAFQGLISLKYDEQIDASGFQSSIAENSIVGKNSGIIRLLEAGIPANKLFGKDGVSLVEKYGLSAEYNTPDVSKAQNEVIKEKLEDNIETLIDRAIGKLEDYLGPKGALQVNFAAVPINILIGGLRATKLAYRGSKNLAKALEAGYKKVQDYMSQQEWLDFTKQAVTEVKKEPTGATVALAIANEKAIKNEQDRQNKIEVLKKAKVYSKADENKTSKELDKKLAEEDDNIRAKNRTEGMERNFRRILRQQTAKGKRPSKWFIPSNAEDIKGLLYAFLPDGKAGVEAKKFFNSAILKPYSDAIAAAEAEILQLSKKFVELKDSAKVKLDENIEGTPYNLGDAVKVYNWNKAGVEVDILKKEYLDKLIGAVEANPEAKYLADEVAANYDIEYNKNWRGVPFNKSIYDTINKGTRTKHLETFSQNVNAIFNKDNLQEIENAFGKGYVQALQNSLKRMQTGRNRVSTDAQSNKFLNWINKSVATTMFFNTRSAALQLLSSLNFIGQKDNNLFKATAALANQEQWQQDYNTLWNSDYLSNRREGAKFDVLADEIAENQESFLNKLLQKGFLPTRYADSFAIALGGAAFYRNRANALMKDGMSKEEAEAQALKDWQASAEETQQSSDPSKISEIQASSIGKIIYAFANTPFQYARKSKRLLQDVASGRSKSEGGMNQVRKDLQSVFYYTVGQAMLFNALQSALFASLFSDDEEEKLEEKTVTAIERALTSYAKSLGNPGAVIGSIYSVLGEANEQIEKRGRIDNAYKLALEATAISPPLNTKLKDIVAIGNIYKYNHKQIEKDPFEVKLDNPVLEIAGNAASFAGYPLDRVIRKAQNLEAVMNEQTDAWEKVFLALGWSKWELGIDLEKRKAKEELGLDEIEGLDLKNIPSLDLESIPGLDLESIPDLEDTALNRLERGVAGRANNDGTIEIDPNLSPVEREKTIAHEEQHMKDMKAGKLNYDDNYVYWNDSKYERKNGKIKYKGKSYIEGHKDLPWEKKAYAAEPSTAQAKKRIKLYA